MDEVAFDALMLHSIHQLTFSFTPSGTSARARYGEVKIESEKNSFDKLKLEATRRLIECNETSKPDKTKWYSLTARLSPQSEELIVIYETQDNPHRYGYISKTEIKGKDKNSKATIIRGELVYFSQNKDKSAKLVTGQIYFYRDDTPEAEDIIKKWEK